MSLEFLQISDDLFIMPSAVSAVKRVSDEACKIFVKGHEFDVPMKAEECVSEIEESLSDEE